MTSTVGEGESTAAIRPRLEKRHFLDAWKKEFPWVIYSHTEGMLCQYCIDAKKKNTFTKGCDKYKKDALAKHALTVDHRAAIQAKACLRDMQQALAHSYRGQELAVIAAL